MKNFCIITFTIIILSCNKNSKPEKLDILDELSIGLVEAWSESKSKSHIPSFIYSIDDTISISNDIRLIIRTSDNLDCTECYITLQAGTTLLITNIDKHIVNLEATLNSDSTVVGYLFKDDLSEAVYPHIDFLRKELLDHFDDKREILKSRLMNKYGLLEAEFYNIVGTKYFEKTGKSGFSFDTYPIFNLGKTGIRKTRVNELAYNKSTLVRAGEFYGCFSD